MHTKNVTEAFVYSHHIQFQTTRYTLLRISLGIAGSKSRLGFQPTSDLFRQCGKKTMKWKADWLTAAWKASLND